MLAAIGRARHGLRQASIVNIPPKSHIQTVLHWSQKRWHSLLLKALIRTNDWRGFQVPHLVAMVGLCCRFPFEYPCRSNFKNNPALLWVIVVVSEKWGNRTGDVWAVESLVVVNAWKASYPVPEFWALRQQRKEWSDWRMSLWLVNKASFDWRDLCRAFL